MPDIMADLTSDLMRDEGFVPHAYQDSEGYWTIGYGRLIDNRLRGSGISQEEGEYLLTNDIRRSIGDLGRWYPWWHELPYPAKRGLPNMAFNLGINRLSGFKNMLAALEAGDFDRAAAEALDSKWARQVKGRATRIADLYRQAKE